MYGLILPLTKEFSQDSTEIVFMQHSTYNRISGHYRLYPFPVPVMLDVLFEFTESFTCLQLVNFYHYFGQLLIFLYFFRKNAIRSSLKKTLFYFRLFTHMRLTHNMSVWNTGILALPTFYIFWRQIFLRVVGLLTFFPLLQGHVVTTLFTGYQFISMVLQYSACSLQQNVELFTQFSFLNNHLLWLKPLQGQSWYQICCVIQW